MPSKAAVVKAILNDCQRSRKKTVILNLEVSLASDEQARRHSRSQPIEEGEKAKWQMQLFFAKIPGTAALDVYAYQISKDLTNSSLFFPYFPSEHGTAVSPQHCDLDQLTPITRSNQARARCPARDRHVIVTRSRNHGSCVGGSEHDRGKRGFNCT
eukprot:1276259-Rhodomonas_salina.1